WAAIGAAFFMAVNLAILLAAIGRIRSARFAGNRRAGTRLPVHVPARLGTRAAQLADLSLTGARVIVAGGLVPRSDRTKLTLDLGRETIQLTCHVRRRAKRSDGHQEFWLEFDAGQETAGARVAVVVFHTESGHPVTPPSEERNLVWERVPA